LPRSRIKQAICLLLLQVFTAQTGTTLLFTVTCTETLILRDCTCCSSAA